MCVKTMIFTRLAAEDGGTHNYQNDAKIQAPACSVSGKARNDV